MHNNVLINKKIRKINAIYTGRISCRWRAILYYIIITISITCYFNQSLSVFHTTDSSYWSSYFSRTHSNMAYEIIIWKRKWSNNNCSCHHHCLYCFYYINWKPNSQGVLMGECLPRILIIIVLNRPLATKTRVNPLRRNK